MFTLPSMWSLIVSVVVFFVAVWYFRRYLDELEIPKGMTRGMLVFTLAYLMSWGAGKAVDWAQGKTQGPQSATQNPGDLSQPLKAADQAQP